MEEEELYQVEDDFGLLEKMLADSEKSNQFFRPSNYWSFYQKKLLPEIRRRGLRDYRRRRHSILTSFSAVDPIPRPQIELKPRVRGSRKINQIIDWAFQYQPLFNCQHFPPEELTHYLYEKVRSKFENLGLNLKQCPTSRFGNPEEQVMIDGELWSLTHLVACSTFADAAKTIPFDSSTTYIELGPGMGRHAEIIAKLYPSATLYLLDIPLQLYVAHQYLRKVFGDRLVTYSDSTQLIQEGASAFASKTNTKIVMLPAWSIEKLGSVKPSIFWNSASFQEMEPDIVANYLSIMKQMAPKHVYINALPKGNYWGAWKPGRGGTKLPVTEECYFRGLEPEYRLASKYFTDHFLRKPSYMSYIFNRA